jgi:hypothetical protein
VSLYASPKYVHAPVFVLKLSENDSVDWFVSVRTGGAIGEGEIMGDGVMEGDGKAVGDEVAVVVGDEVTGCRVTVFVVPEGTDSGVPKLIEKLPII